MVGRAASTPHTDLTTAVRREVVDPALDRAGLAKTNTRWVQADIDQAIKNALMYLGRELRLVDPSSAYLISEHSYTAGAYSVALSTINYFDPVVKVEQVDDPQRPILLPYINAEEIERYALSTNSMAYVPRGYPYRYSLIDMGTDRHIVIRPRPQSTVGLIVTRIAPPMLWSTGDNHAMAAHWEDLIVLLAAESLLSPREGLTEDQRARLNRLLDQFRPAANRRRQSQRIGRKRVGWS